MNPLSIPSLIAAVLFLFLSIAVISYNPRAKVNVLLGILSFNWMLFALAVFMFHLSEDIAPASFWNKWPYALLLPSVILTVYYSILLNNLDKKWDERIIYLPIKGHFFIYAGMAIFFWLAVIFSDLLIAPPKLYPVTGYEHTYGPLFLPFNLFCVYGLILLIATFRHGIRSAGNALERYKIAFSSWGLFIGLSFAFLFGMILPFFDIQTHSLATLPFALISMCFIYAIIKYQFLEIQEKLWEIERTSRLKRYLSPQVVETIMSGQERGLALKNERREVTVFFSDLRGFTRFSDSVEPEEVIQLLNSYHAEMGKLIFKYDGTLERFAGDAIMVIFGAPIPCEHHALKAVKMALEMRGRFEPLKREWERKDYRLDIGIGISSGYATVGNVGFEGRMDYSAIGTVTNLAARLCERAKGGQILMSKAVFLHVEDQVEVQEIGKKQYKGFHRPVVTFELIGLR
ncbi:MAG: hypothetical protein JSW35_05130 [Deltaproteobacteria bacterium]|nr:MAG: hypothetical protein JSW35_05130 [Deltaproteobacteria bacterium]